MSISYYQDLYSITGIGASLGQSMLYEASRRYMKEKEHLKMEIETYFKYNSKEDSIRIYINYFEFPYLADLKINKNN